MKIGYHLDNIENKIITEVDIHYKIKL